MAETEMAEAVKAVQESIPGHVILFTQTASAMGGEARRNRRLVLAASSGGNETAAATCDGLCSTKVMILETIFVVRPGWESVMGCKCLAGLLPSVNYGADRQKWNTGLDEW